MWCLACTQVIVKFAGREIPKSPYSVMVDAAPGDASKCHAQGPGIEKTGNMVNKKTYFEIFTTSRFCAIMVSLYVACKVYI